MARTLRRLALWAVATGLAVCVSWLGVQRVLAADATDGAPRVVPVDRLASPAATSALPTGPPTSATAPAGPVTPSPTSPSPAGTTAAAGAASGPPGPPASSPPAAPADDTDVQSYQLTGGRVVLELTATSARLVSATPDDGWRVQAWQADGWLRVDFSRDATTSSLFATWNGHPPSVQTT